MCGSKDIGERATLKVDPRRSQVEGIFETVGFNSHLTRKAGSFFFFFFSFLGLPPRHMEVPRLGIKLEL